MTENEKISNRFSMSMSNELPGPIPVSWIRQDRWMISVKLMLMQQMVAAIENNMWTDGWTNLATPQYGPLCQAYKKWGKSHMLQVYYMN